MSGAFLTWRKDASALYRGVLLAVTIAIAATWISAHYGAPAFLIALLIGMAFHFLSEDPVCQPGIEFSSKTLLRIGVALLGARITLDQIQSLGWLPIVLVISGVASTIAVGISLSRLFGQSRSFGLLSGASVGICGASAALAISSALPQGKEQERSTLLIVVAVTSLSTIAMISYPILSSLLDLNGMETGLFLGGTIHDVAQVVGAGYSVSDEAGDAATYVKLLRVAMLVPVVAIVTLFAMSSKEERPTTGPPIPLFLFGFIALVAVSALNIIPSWASAGLSTLSGWMLVVAISALGVKTSFQKLAGLGWHPLALLVIETVWIAFATLLIIAFGPAI